ncbi:J domain-containing protein [Methylomonas sp. SURF-2]|uniref:J domain-containing protein n=1 Tax=Methylomonas subterranea TaxID=2952225 RepID=A0ABT1TCC0_9GAMM|nr:J domain-containing protein [Methylomonas sp. SURF-2]MCQ8102752.1 J domain-containing protein [Methylomonas sp. SURF-2]
MNTPYQILGVTEQASDAEIKQAYLEKVKHNPPDRDQQRFQQIHRAYETIKDEDSRLRYALFHWPGMEFDELLEHVFKPADRISPLPADEFLKLLSSVSIEQTLAKKIN